MITNFGVTTEDDSLDEWQQLLEYTNGHKGVIVGIDEIQNWFMSGLNKLPEGKLIGLQPNRRFGYDVLYGVFYVTGQDRRGNLTSLSPAAVERYQKVFAAPEIIDSEEAEATMMAMFCSI